MNRDAYIKDISRQLENGNDVDFEYEINGIPYKIKFLASDIDKGINISSILVIPLLEGANDRLVVEANNLESGNLEEIIKQGAQTGIRLTQLTRDLPTPIVVPLIPSYKDYPYLQQLSQECFSISSDDRNYRIDEQVVKVIDRAKSILEKEKGLVVKDKIFLNGYSSSGVFAQRFALLHPDIVETACIGGASGSIPIPTEEMAYPIGIADYESLIGKKFDFESYSKIKFRYYVGELETQNKSDSRVDDFGQPAPMHDMSYFDRSVPTEVGKHQRSILGTEMFSRAENTIQILQNLGIDVQHRIFLGRSHNNRNGIGVNELGDKFINDTYKSTIERKKIEMFQEGTQITQEQRTPNIGPKQVAQVVEEQKVTLSEIQEVTQTIQEIDMSVIKKIMFKKRTGQVLTEEEENKISEYEKQRKQHSSNEIKNTNGISIQ